jgi:hypothetical protein
MENMAPRAKQSEARDIILDRKITDQTVDVDLAKQRATDISGRQKAEMPNKR